MSLALTFYFPFPAHPIILCQEEASERIMMEEST